MCQGPNSEAKALNVEDLELSASATAAPTSQSSITRDWRQLSTYDLARHKLPSPSALAVASSASAPPLCFHPAPGPEHCGTPGPRRHGLRRSPAPVRRLCSRQIGEQCADGRNWEVDLSELSLCGFDLQDTCIELDWTPSIVQRPGLGRVVWH